MGLTCRRESAATRFLLYGVCFVADIHDVDRAMAALDLGAFVNQRDRLLGHRWIRGPLHKLRVKYPEFRIFRQVRWRLYKLVDSLFSRPCTT